MYLLRTSEPSKLQIQPQLIKHMKYPPHKCLIGSININPKQIRIYLYYVLNYLIYNFTRKTFNDNCEIQQKYNNYQVH